MPRKQRQKYVLGFAFDADLKRLLLVRKRSGWQADKLNGVGGKVEFKESALNAMIREFAEEVGEEIVTWFPVTILQFENAEVHVFTTKLRNEEFVKTFDSIGCEEVCCVWYPDLIIQHSEGELVEYTYNSSALCMEFLQYNK